LNRRCQPHLKRANKSYRVDETYIDETYIDIEVKGQNKYLYRAVDSTGQTVDFLLAAKRDTAAAKRFFEKVFSSSSNPVPRVINEDKNSAYPAAVEGRNNFLFHSSAKLRGLSSGSRRSLRSIGRSGESSGRFRRIFCVSQFV
jgi:transposase-like protein